MATRTIEFMHQLEQILVNQNYTTTDHKMQGMSYDVLIMSSSPTGPFRGIFTDWKYVVSSHVWTLSGLYRLNQWTWKSPLNHQINSKGTCHMQEQKKHDYWREENSYGSTIVQAWAKGKIFTIQIKLLVSAICITPRGHMCMVVFGFVLCISRITASGTDMLYYPSKLHYSLSNISKKKKGTI